ncbi:MAG: hypothetical protein ACU84Q_07125 [Gammaproteobacteria bacterium]
MNAFMLLTLTALPLLAAGIVGVTSPELLPWSPNPPIAWSLPGVGVMMDGAAVVAWLGELRRVREAHSRRH